MPRVIIWMEGGTVTGATSDIPGLKVFKIEQDDPGDGWRGDNYRQLLGLGDEPKIPTERWAYYVGRADRGKRLLDQLVPQILSDDTLATWCRGCEETILLKDAKNAESKDGPRCVPCNEKHLKENPVGRTA